MADRTPNTHEAAASPYAVNALTGAKANTPSARAGTNRTVAPQPAKRSPRPVRLTDRQTDVLWKVKGTATPGYRGGKSEQRTLDALADKKLLKRGPKHKESGCYHYTLSKWGEKHLGVRVAGNGPGSQTNPTAGLNPSASIDEA